MAGPSRAVSLRGLWLFAVCGIGVLQICAGVAGLVASGAGVSWPRATSIPDWQRALVILAFAGLASYLLLGARRDARIQHFGGLVLLVAVFFAHPPIAALERVLPELGQRSLALARSVTVDAFTPALFWLFVRDFPRALRWPLPTRLISFAVALSVGAASLLIVVNLAIGLRGEAGALAAFDRADVFSHYWTVVFGLIVPALPVMFWRLRHAPLDERRRVGLFVVGIGIASVLPITYAIAPPLSPGIERFFNSATAEALLRPLNFLMIVGLAGVTAYSVLVQRVLDVRTVVRKAAQYTMARLVVVTLVAAPFGALAFELYRRRADSPSIWLEGGRAWWAAALLLAGIVVLRLRRNVMQAIDRLFFRDAYDARRILAEVAEGSRSAASVADLVRSLTSEVDRALHLETIALLMRGSDGGDYVPVTGRAGRLEPDSGLLGLLRVRRQPLSIDLERPGSVLHTLPEVEQLWLVDAGAEVIVPLVGSGDGVSGLLVLGAKRSELPYTREDLLMLAAVGAAAGIGVENLLLREPREPGPTSDERPSAECLGCGRVEPWGTPACESCGEKLIEGRLPLVLFEKFSLDRRLGSGAMGVVYRARDQMLGRPVALKTLPATNAADAVRLRREARAMAAVTHPNLALIFGAETWKGTPVLVMEYLAGGTLADRLREGPMTFESSLTLAAELARALQRVHGAGLLHRDVKPSNIGLTETSVPKLLDFGLVGIIGAGAGGASLPATSSSDRDLPGTPLYMSPEALRGRAPEPSFDLWSLAVVAFEASAGRHPFERPTPTATAEAIMHVDMLDPRTLRPDCPEPVALLFEAILAPEPGRRPATGDELAALLDATVQDIAA